MPPIRLRTADPLLVVLRARTLLSDFGSFVNGPALEALACATGNYIANVSLGRHPPVPIPPLLAVPSDLQQKSTSLVCTKQGPAHACGFSTTSATTHADLPLTHKRQRPSPAAEGPSPKRSRPVKTRTPARRNSSRAAKDKRARDSEPSLRARKLR
ncbi:hypothetical protein CYLTODRAFT_197041 [Cylindrobasidium torrendii FP15055 ss-10]|uniref:Uncharacterized protein n=1 Tax=Cylindrobasidium torrendii FP15055 ss-10 TaxID=1314674 RepID=A0A0D7AUI7_9AGAR|nr:hypothetical protein CYLTODRAFT_197041 [Cylindrobasidium torrendii FP15055 ss-10]